MSSHLHLNQQLVSSVATSLSSKETSSVFQSSADEECTSTSDSHLTLEPIICCSSSHGDLVDCPLSLSSNCGELKSTPDMPSRVDNVSREILPQSNYTCSSQQLASQSVLPLSSACGVVTINGETQNQTGQHEEVSELIQLELSDCSFSSQENAELALSQSPDSHGISCMDNLRCSDQVKVNQTGLPMEEPGNSASLISDNSEQSTISSYQSDPFISGTPQQFNTEKSCQANCTSALPISQGCVSKISADSNDQGQLGNNETNDHYQVSALSSKETNDLCQVSALSSKETNDQCQVSALSSKEPNDPCQVSALSSKETNDLCQVSALSSKETNDQCQVSALSSKETNDPCQVSALSGKDTNDQSQVSALSSKETNDQSQVSALSSKETNDQSQVFAPSSKETNDQNQVSSSSSKETNDQNQVSSSSSKDSSCKLYNFVIFHEDEEDAVERIFFLLEQEHHLRGFQNGRDDIPGTFKGDEIVKAIENSEKILLLLTPKSVDNEQFKFLMHLSLRQSVEDGTTKLIPIRWRINKLEIPKVLRSKYHIDYEDFSDNFQARLSKVFLSQSSLTSGASKKFDSHSASSTCSVESEASTNSSDSPKCTFRQSHSVPPFLPKKKPWYARVFSSPK